MAKYNRSTSKLIDFHWDWHHYPSTRNYANGKRKEGGKYILEDGQYYIGQFKN